MVKGIMAMFRKKTPSNWIEGMSWELKTTRFLSIFTLWIVIPAGFAFSMWIVFRVLMKIGGQ